MSGSFQRSGIIILQHYARKPQAQRFPQEVAYFRGGYARNGKPSGRILEMQLLRLVRNAGLRAEGEIRAQAVRRGKPRSFANEHQRNFCLQEFPDLVADG